MLAAGKIIAGAGSGPATASARRVPGHGQMEEQQGGQHDDQAGKNHQQDYDQESFDIGLRASRQTLSRHTILHLLLFAGRLPSIATLPQTRIRAANTPGIEL